MTNEEITRFFNTTRPFIQGNPDLRDPQVEGWFRTRQQPEQFRTRHPPDSGGLRQDGPDGPTAF
jgi:hypothetical protein